jgi:hypothetical protein
MAILRKMRGLFLCVRPADAAELEQIAPIAAIGLFAAESAVLIDFADGFDRNGWP